MKRLILCLAFLALLAACGQDSPEPEGESSPLVAPISDTSPALTEQLLSRIDSEPMMLWLSLEPLPEALLDQLWARMEMAGELNQDTYDEVSEDVEDPLARALILELGALDSEQAWAERGIEVAGVAGVHTVGLFPFLHWQLSDEAAFTAMLARIEAEAETEFTRRTVGDQSIIWHSLGEVGIAIHHDENFLTAALVADRPELLRRVANIDQAENPLQPAQVNAFNTARGFRNDSAGYIDFQRFADLLLNSNDEMLVAARTEGPLANIANDEACATEIMALTQIFPRQSFGTTAASETSMTILTRLETAPDFGLKLAALADTPMSLDIESGGLLSTAMALNLVATRDFGRELVAGWIDNPPECHIFSAIVENASEWQLALNQPIPPLVTNMHGLRLKLDGLQIEEGQLSSATGNLALFMRNPQMMIGMAQMFSPELAALDLTPGSGPQPVPPGLVPNLPEIPTWLGLSDSALGLAFGTSDGLVEALEPGVSDSRIFAAGVDLATYSELVELGLSALPEGPAGEFDSAETDEAMALMASIYQYVYKAVYLGEPGIDLVFRFELTD